MTNDLVRRVYEHQNDLIDGFTRKYGLHRLVYYESTGDIESAILREKKLKKWNRKWKIRLIEKLNSDWEDLYTDLAGHGSPTCLAGRQAKTFGMTDREVRGHEKLVFQT